MMHRPTGPVLLALCTLALAGRPAAAVPTPISGNLLVNPGFETVEGIDTERPSTFGDWAHDGATIVTAENGISPHGGQRMLRFDFTSSIGPTIQRVGANIVQLVDMAPFAADIATGRVRADASYFVNRVAGGPMTDTRFDVQIAAYDGVPADFNANVESPLDQSILIHFSDADTVTWEMIGTSLLVPTTTTYLAVTVTATENVFNDDTLPEFDGHFGDDVSPVLSLLPESSAAVPEPSFAWLAVAVVCWWGRRLRVRCAD